MRPTVSVVVPTYNEEAAIAKLLENLCAIGADEIIVADGHSSDRTGEIASGYPGIRFLCSPTPNRAVQMNLGAAWSTGDILLFLHADVRLGPNSLHALRKTMSDPAVLGGNFDIQYEGGDLAASWFTAVNRWRCRWGIFYGDSGIFCRRSVFEHLGGYRDWPLMEDYEFARKLWMSGKISFLTESIYVSNRRWKKSGLFSTVVFWIVIQALYQLRVSPRRLARLYGIVR
ncbi:MAG: TIGR04283 family arsenosugar biosynthesis glycosyltransferase [Bryobacteraceae bacterium]